jgi:hypothetical protein
MNVNNTVITVLFTFNNQLACEFVDITNLCTGCTV